MKSFLSLSLLALLCFGCNKTEKTTLKPNSLTLNVTEDPHSLDPRIVRTLKDLTVVKQLFDGLMRTDATGKPQGAIAESVEISEDGMTYTFHLRDAKWTNGDPVTAHDFVYAWSTVLSPDFPTDYAHMLFPIKNAKSVKEGKCALDTLGVKASDEKTLVVGLENPTPYFLELVSFPTSFPIHSKIASKDNSWALPPGHNFVSNGPFSISEWSPDNKLELKKSTTYWEQEKVHLEGLSFIVVGDTNTESYLYEKGELDWLGQPLSGNISTELLAKLKKENKLNSYPVAGTFWLKYNTQRAPFNDKLARQAFAYAIHRDKIIEHILRGGQQSAQEILPPSMAVQKNPLFEDGNLPLAQKLFEEYLAQKGLTRETFPKVTLTYNPSERNNKITQFVADEWHKAFGIEITLEGIELQSYRQKVKQGLFQVGNGDWIADFNDPVAFLDLFKYRKEDQGGNGMNDTGWHNDEFTALLDLCKAETDVTKRNEMLEHAEKILIDEMPVAPLYHYSFDYVKREGVQDVVLSPLGPADFKYAKKEDCPS